MVYGCPPIGHFNRISGVIVAAVSHLLVSGNAEFQAFFDKGRANGFARIRVEIIVEPVIANRDGMAHLGSVKEM